MSVLKDILRPVYYRIPQRIRLGLAFYRDLARYEAMQKLPLDKRREYQLQELQRIVYYAYEYTRYYRRLFDEYGIKPGDIKDFSDMKKIPYLTKDTVRAHREELVADCVREKNLIYVTTGGSTGEPLGFYISKNADRKRLIFEWINWRHMGYMVGDKCAVLRGNIVKNGFFRYDRGHEYLILSTYRMTDELLPRYLEKIEEYKPEVIQGYPSALEIMAKFMLKTGRKLNAALKAISTSSEILYPEQKKMIEEAFNCKVWDKYGNSEQVGVIGMCSAGCYHEFMEHSYLEYEATGEGETYEIVGTSFINDAMPFIRYRTGDLCRLRGGYLSLWHGISSYFPHYRPLARRPVEDALWQSYFADRVKYAQRYFRPREAYSILSGYRRRGYLKNRSDEGLYRRGLAKNKSGIGDKISESDKAIAGICRRYSFDKARKI